MQILELIMDYIPIYLIEKGISPRAIAMDINRGPLKRAKIHIRERGMEEVIETRLSDGPVCPAAWGNGHYDSGRYGRRAGYPDP